MKLKGTIIIIAILATTQSAMAFKHQESKVIERVFSCRNAVELDLSNKYGDISINTWEKDEIKINATIVVSSKKDNAQEILDNIDIEFSHNPLRITAQERTIKKMKRENYSYSITYKVLVPKYAHLDMENYNGHIYIHDCSGDIISESKYGNIIFTNTNSPNLKINAYNGNISIENCRENTKNIEIYNKYGNLSIDGYYQSANIDIYNGNVDIQNKDLDALKTKILSKYGYVALNGNSRVIDINVYNGNVKLGEDTNADSTNIYSKYGNITLGGKLKNITIKGYNGNIDVANESIPGNIIISSKYGQVKYIGNFTMMAINNYNGNINIENTGDSAEGTVITTKYSNIKYLGYAKNMSITNYNGNIDVDNNTSPKIKNLIVSNSHGQVNLNNVENINIISSNNDTYNIVNCNSITINDAKYTSFNIDGLKDSFIGKNQIKFGKINIKRIDPIFKTIEISNYYATISLSFRQLNDYSIDISGKFGGIKIAEALKNPDLKIIEADSTFQVTQKGTTGKILIDNQYGDIRLEKEQ